MLYCLRTPLLLWQLCLSLPPQTGAWGCFDEFNRINIEVLSVVAQQILSILSALAANLTRFHFEGFEINLVWSCGIFITMNPGRWQELNNMKVGGRGELGVWDKCCVLSFSLSVPKCLAVKYLTKDSCVSQLSIALTKSPRRLSLKPKGQFGLHGLSPWTVISEPLVKVRQGVMKEVCGGTGLLISQWPGRREGGSGRERERERFIDSWVRSNNLLLSCRPHL